MGKRREPRKPVQLSVRIFGTDGEGKIFSETVTAADVSQNGARVTGVRAKPAADEIIGVTYGKNKVHFRVKWIGEMGSPREGELGLLNLTPEKPFWDFPQFSSDPGAPADCPRQVLNFGGTASRRPAGHLGQSFRPKHRRLFRGNAHPAAGEHKTRYCAVAGRN